MLGRFLRDDAWQLIQGLALRPAVAAHCQDVLERGYTVIPAAIPAPICARVIQRFRETEAGNPEIFGQHRDAHGHYPRIVNLHNIFPDLMLLLTRNALLLETLDALFGAPTSLYTSLFYETGSQQPLHRDTPVFCTRPEYLYFGTTVYLEPTDDGNGCLEVLEGGHRIPELDREAMAAQLYGGLDQIPRFDGAAWEAYQDETVARGLAMGLERRHLHVNAGDTVIWHPQLPHGGTPIRDLSRTRFSLVMHVTPEGVPVHQQDAFFHPSAPFPTEPAWSYYEFDGRRIAEQRYGVDFGHQRVYPMSDFRIPAPLFA